MALYYCKKCGDTWIKFLEKDSNKCYCCGSDGYVVPEKYLLVFENELYNDNFKDEESKQLLIEELVKTSPEFDQYLFDHRDEILAKQSAEFNAKMAIGKAIAEGKKVSRQEMLSGKLNENRTDVSCPYCHSYNTKKITVGSKAVHTALFGLWSMGRNSKNYHCNQCGSEW